MDLEDSYSQSKGEKSADSKEPHPIAMSADSDSKFIPEPSQGDYWNGYMLDFLFYKILAVFPLTGFFGMDHLALRSPGTATLKFFVNLFFWGAWYFYDIIQVLIDEKSVAKYGMSTPYGPRGHGYKFFKNVTEDNLNEFPKPSPQYGGFVSTILFIFYAMSCLYFSFLGLPSLFAGDYMGGMMKIVSLALIITFPIYLFTGVFEYFNAGSLELKGAKRTWPFIPGLMAFLMHDPNNTYPAVNLLPKEEAEKQLIPYQQIADDYHKEQEGKKTPFARAWDALYHLPDPYLGAGKLAGAGADAVQAGAKVTQVTANALAKVAAENPAALIPGAGAAALAPPPPPNAAATAPPPQTGGGMARGPDGLALDTIVMSGMAFLAIGGLAAAFLRKMSVPTRTDEPKYPRSPSERDDAPPEPDTV